MKRRQSTISPQRLPAHKPSDALRCFRSACFVCGPQSLEFGIGGVIHFVFAAVYLLIWGVDLLTGFSTFSATVLALTFVFGNRQATGTTQTGSGRAQRKGTGSQQGRRAGRKGGAYARSEPAGQSSLLRLFGMPDGTRTFAWLQLPMLSCRIALPHALSAAIANAGGPSRHQSPNCQPPPVCHAACLQPFNLCRRRTASSQSPGGWKRVVGSLPWQDLASTGVA